MGPKKAKVMIFLGCIKREIKKRPKSCIIKKEKDKVENMWKKKDLVFCHEPKWCRFGSFLKKIKAFNDVILSTMHHFI